MCIIFCGILRNMLLGTLATENLQNFIMQCKLYSKFSMNEVQNK